MGNNGRDEEDAFGKLFMFNMTCAGVTTGLLPEMRKPLSRDPGRKSVRASGRDIVVSLPSASSP